MNMSLARVLCRICQAVATAALLSSCTHPPIQPPPAPRPVGHLAQLGHGARADFVRCVPPACPTPTPKTLDRLPGTTAARAPHPVAPVPIAPDPVVPASVPDPATETVLPPVHVVAPAIAESRTWTVHFAFGSAELGPTARTILRAVAAALPDAGRIRITGRTDATGPADVNDALAAARAHAVREHLARARPERQDAMTVEAAGKCCFAASNDTAAGRALNRRVDIAVDRPAPPGPQPTSGPSPAPALPHPLIDPLRPVFRRSTQRRSS
ncbi:OmpA family protein [Thauera sp. Sel9]|uniref:OmpA family protein n=1 Tax=Thauera sp. Sel9 TaxID=2974299 RepID=UPI0021E17AB3|nr:OmpA family protein [Thauera sp. Sel9]MCV2219859.1 OmpA family protein [Thauera sp. Sel9]